MTKQYLDISPEGLSFANGVYAWWIMQFRNSICIESYHLKVIYHNWKREIWCFIDKYEYIYLFKQYKYNLVVRFFYSFCCKQINWSKTMKYLFGISGYYLRMNSLILNKNYYYKFMCTFKTNNFYLIYPRQIKSTGQLQVCLFLFVWIVTWL